MASKLLLECAGLESRTLNVPAFQVSLGEVVAVIEPTYDGEETISLMELLSGWAATQGVEAHCKTAIVHPFLCCAQYEEMIDRPLPDLLHANGLTAAEANEVIVAAGLQPDYTYGQVQLTNRLLLDIRIAVLRGVQLVVLSTGGLDPLGVDRVLTEARSSRTQCSSLALFHESLASYHESTGLFDRLCDRLLLIKKRSSASATGNPA